MKSSSAISDVTTLLAMPSDLAPAFNQFAGAIIGTYSGRVYATANAGGRELRIYPDQTIPANTSFYIGGMFIV